MFRTVPSPGFCLSGNQRNNTNELITKVEVPIDQANFFDNPCAKTVHGLTPMPAATRNASPNPNIAKPTKSAKKETGFGNSVSVSIDVQDSFGMDPTVKIL